MTLGHDTHGANPDDVRPVPRIAIQAFCETADVAQLLEATADDRRMSRAHLKIQMGGLPAAVEFYASAPTPNLVLVESRGRAEDILSQLDGLADVCDPGTKVMVIGHVNDVVLYRDLVRRGVSEYIVMPLTMFDVVRAIGELYEHASTPLGRTVAVLGAKGGTGSSTVAHNVAWAVGKQFANDVMIADFDLAWGTAGLDFNQDPTQGMLEALNSPERLDEVFLDRLLTKCSDRLSILAAPALLDRTYDQRENDYDTIVEVARSIVPLVILDLPHQWSSWVRRQTCEADDVFLVATPDLASLRNARAGRRAEGRPAQRRAAASGAEHRRHAEAARDQARGIRQGAGARDARRHPLRRGRLRQRRQQGPDDRRTRRQARRQRGLHPAGDGGDGAQGNPQGQARRVRHRAAPGQAGRRQGVLIVRARS